MSPIFSSIVDVEFDKFLPVKIISVRFNQPLLVSLAQPSQPSHHAPVSGVKSQPGPGEEGDLL